MSAERRGAQGASQNEWQLLEMIAEWGGAQGRLKMRVIRQKWVPNEEVLREHLIFGIR